MNRATDKIHRHTLHMAAVARGLILTSALLVLLGCGKGGNATETLPDVLHAMKASYAPHITHEYDGRNATAVQALYETVRALPPYQNAGNKCPLARGLK